MQKLFICCLFIITLFGAGFNQSYAAFPVKVATVIATEEEAPVKKTFKETKTGRFISQVKYMAHARPYVEGSRPKSGWPGIVSLVCAAAALLCLVSVAVAPFFFVFAVAAIIFGAVGVSPRRHTNTGLALAGLILGALEILAVVLIVAAIIAAFG